MRTARKSPLFGISSFNTLRFLGLCLLVTVTSAQAGEYRLMKVSESVHVAVRMPILEYPVEGNVSIIINDRDVVLVDSPRTPESALRVAALVRTLTDKPVRYLINTHWHGDHHHGNAVFQEEFPGLEILGSRFAREEILTRGRSSLEGQIERFRNRDRMEAQLQETDLAADQRYRLTRLLEMPKDYSDQLSQVKLRPPALTYDRLLELHRAERRIQIRTLGAGNTRGDAVIVLPEDRVVITGDLVVETVPFMSLSQPLSWLERLEEIAALDVDWIVPGHGRPMQDRLWLLRHIRLLRSLAPQIEACVDRQQRLEACRENIQLEDFRQEYSQGDPSLANEFDYRVTGPAVRDAYQEWTQRLFGLGRKQHTLLEEHVRQLQTRVLLLEGSFPKEQFEGWLTTLHEIDAVLDDQDWELGLVLVQNLQTSLAGYELLNRADREQIDLPTLEAWSRAYRPSSPNLEGLSDRCAPALVCAVIEESVNRGERYIKAAVQYGEVSQVSSGAFYLGRGAGFVNFARFALELLATESSVPLQWDGRQGVEVLRARSQELFKSHPKSRLLIQANAVLKEVEELLEQERHSGAVLRALEARFLLEQAPLEEEESFNRQQLARVLSRYLNGVASSPRDHSVVELFLQRAIRDLRSDWTRETSSKGREAKAIVESVLPFYVDLISNR